MCTKRIDMTGMRFSRVTAIRDVGRSSSRDRKWLFSCDCGETFEANGYAVRIGKVKDCPTCARGRVTEAHIKHGKSETPEFKIWTDMHTRCYNPNANCYKDYGGRGISICKQWRESFKSFLSDMGLRPSLKHSIDRINVNGDYSPDNCRWATPSQQARNKRNNVLITIDNETKTLTEWAKHFGVGVAAASIRHKQGHIGMAIFSTTVKQITHLGITDTIAGWSKRTGIKGSTINMRISKYGWAIHDALTKGATL